MISSISALHSMEYTTLLTTTVTAGIYHIYLFTLLLLLLLLLRRLLLWSRYGLADGGEHVASGGVARGVGRCTAREGAEGVEEDDGRAAATDVEGPVRDAGDSEADDAARLGSRWEQTVQRHVAFLYAAVDKGRHLRRGACMRRRRRMMCV